MMRFRNLIKEVLGKFDIGVYKISKAHPNAQGLPINNPIEHNTLETADKYYGNPKIVKEYLEPARIRFYEELIEFVLSRGLNPAGKSVVDVGCGPGVLLSKLSEAYPDLSLTGYDHSVKALDVAKKICPAAKFETFDIYKENGERFDLVWCTEVLEHLVYPEKALKTLLGMVKPGGDLVLTVPNGRSDTFLGHINFWSPESWKVFIEQGSSGYTADISMMGSTNIAILKNPIREVSDA